jgi:hypothetical protein
MGCTVGQGTKGSSTQAAGVLIAFVATIFGSTLAMKIHFFQVLAVSLAVFYLLTNGLRSLNTV